MGNGLGAGSAALAKLSAKAAAATVPLIWVVLASLLLVPASQRFVIGVFTSETDPGLLRTMHHLLNLLSLLLLFDGAQFGELVEPGLASAVGQWTGIMHQFGQAAGSLLATLGWSLTPLPAAAPTAGAVLSGMAAGAGKQTRGFAINTFAHWGLALPSAIVLGFHFHWGVEGLYSGVVLGPLAQLCCYLVLILRLNWDKEAAEAHAAMLRVAASTGGAGI